MQLNSYSVDTLGFHELCPVSAVTFSPILMLCHIHKMNKISEIKILWYINTYDFIVSA
jgi:hypothetical protein